MARTVNREQHQQRRTAITEAAATLFARQGFARTTTAQIAEAAGTSPGNMFHYFADKPAIFRAIFEQDIPTSRELFQKHAEPEDPAASLMDVVDALAAPARDGRAPGLLVELLRQAGNDPQLREIVGTNDAIVRGGIAELVRRAAAEGRADPDLDADRAAAWVSTVVDAAYLNAEQGTDPLPMLRLIIARFLALPDGIAIRHGQ
ncbi:TetR/AcrR family transcriptional regulator [Saccharopolyspora sp. HNM0983]|uniref:TetR/AcrR family transcriptional regulator n=1 Tax=Saccharopolyspora montiporae TaxID=2781240 RepID=A0A929B8A5_9PSEU|nr:TetR/AcrR family transcriptional regulator [Saccharopolyspora sp. HNM0983]MBE9373660.1 TetR/AcrR family transcriptional regulator [Saccharopolyspora sp. HNM0983]